MIKNGVLFHQDNAPAYSSVVVLAPVVPGRLVACDLVNMVGAELVGSSSPEWLPWQPLINVQEHCSGETRRLM